MSPGRGIMNKIYKPNDPEGWNGVALLRVKLRKGRGPAKSRTEAKPYPDCNECRPSTLLRTELVKNIFDVFPAKRGFLFKKYER
jgi:hypothetical protein